jgi:hypothetical protein
MIWLQRLSLFLSVWFGIFGLQLLPARPAAAQTRVCAECVQVAQSTAGPILQFAEQPFRVAGISYYPQATPWDRFWPLYNPAIIEADLTRIGELGLNTVRILVPFDQVGGAQVSSQFFDQLDHLLIQAEQRNLKVIITLFEGYRSYDSANWPQAQQYLTALGQRFAGRSTILAWDLKRAPDQDYATFGQPIVQSWLEQVLTTARAAFPGHLVTISWSNPAAAATLAQQLDLVSFQFYAASDQFLDQYAALRVALPGKPILVSEFGLSTWNSWFFPNGQTEEEQAAAYASLLTAVRLTDAVGTVAWTLYDFNSFPPALTNAWPWEREPIAQFGVLRADGSRKAAATLLAPTASLAVPQLPFWSALLKPFWLTVLGSVVLIMLLVVGLLRLRRSHEIEVASTPPRKQDWDIIREASERDLRSASPKAATPQVFVNPNAEDAPLPDFTANADDHPELEDRGPFVSPRTANEARTRSADKQPFASGPQKSGGLSRPGKEPRDTKAETTPVEPPPPPPPIATVFVEPTATANTPLVTPFVEPATSQAPNDEPMIDPETRRNLETIKNTGVEDQRAVQEVSTRSRINERHERTLRELDQIRQAEDEARALHEVPPEEAEDEEPDPAEQEPPPIMIGDEFALPTERRSRPRPTVSDVTASVIDDSDSTLPDWVRSESAPLRDAIRAQSEAVPEPTLPEWMTESLRQTQQPTPTDEPTLNTPGESSTSWWGIPNNPAIDPLLARLDPPETSASAQPQTDSEATTPSWFFDAGTTSTPNELPTDRRPEWLVFSENDQQIGAVQPTHEPELGTTQGSASRLRYIQVVAARRKNRRASQARAQAQADWDVIARASADDERRLREQTNVEPAAEAPNAER